MINQEALLDKEFLKELFFINQREKYVKIVSLDWDENPKEEIQGIVTSGSINIDGNSAERRSCSLSLVAKDQTITDYYWTFKTKFKLYTGLKNIINPKYPDIIWFLQGTFLITSFNKSKSTNNYTISINGKDKMSLLSGSLGGVVTASSVDFGSIDIYDREKDMTVNEKLKLKDIIREAVHEYAREPYHNIIINDLDFDANELLEYRGTKPLYFYIDTKSNEFVNFLDENTKIYIKNGSESWRQTTITDKKIIFDLRVSSLNDDAFPPTKIALNNNPGDNLYTVVKIEYGDTAGYRLTDLVFNGELIANVGSSITQGVLDKLTKMLGNYEYFYNIEGKFVFQQKPSYMSTSWNPLEGTYLETSLYNTSYDYEFKGNEIISSFATNPQVANVKNDFSIWGARKGVSGADIPIHLRFAIDKKPKKYTSLDGITYISDYMYEQSQEQFSFIKINYLSEAEKQDYDSTCNQLAKKYAENYDSDEEIINALILNHEGKELYLYYKNINENKYELVLPKKVVGMFQDTFKVDWISGVDYYLRDIPQSTLVKCDWREIIYQMTQDYKKHYHDDDFVSRIAKNNPIDYPTGYTGYEPYYTDLDGFWRQLYNPGLEWTPSEEKKLSNITSDDVQQGRIGKKNNFTKISRIDLSKADRKKWYEKSSLSTIGETVSYSSGLFTIRNPYAGAGQTKLLESGASFQKPRALEFKLKKCTHSRLGDFSGYPSNDINVRNRQVKVVIKSALNNLHLFSFILPYNQTYKLDFEKNIIYKGNNEVSLSSVQGLGDLNFNDRAIIISFSTGIDKNSNVGFAGDYYTCDVDVIFNNIMNVKNCYVNSYDALNVWNIYQSKNDFLVDLYYKNIENNYVKVQTEKHITTIRCFEKGIYYISNVTKSEDGDFPAITLFDDWKDSSVLTATIDQWQDNKWIQIASINSTGEIHWKKTDDFGKDYVFKWSENNLMDIRVTIDNVGPPDLVGLNINVETDRFTTKDSLEEFLKSNKIKKDELYMDVYPTETDKKEFLKEKRPLIEILDLYNLNKYLELNTTKWQIVELEEFDTEKNQMKEQEYTALSFDSYGNPTGQIFIIDPKVIYAYQDETDKFSQDEMFQGTDKYGWHRNVFENPALLNFWFDFLDGGRISDYATYEIGNRPKAVNDTNIKSIYFKETPTVMYIFDKKTNEEFDELKEKYSGYTLIKCYSAEMQDMFTLSAQGKSAKDTLDDFLYNNTYAVEALTLTTPPIYDLQPNTRIKVVDQDEKIDGEYIVTKLTVPLAYNGTMSITANQIAESIL